MSRKGKEPAVTRRLHPAQEPRPDRQAWSPKKDPRHLLLVTAGTRGQR